MEEYLPFEPVPGMEVYFSIPPVGPGGPDPQSNPAPSFEQALKPKGDGDVHPVKYLPYSSDQGM